MCEKLHAAALKRRQNWRERFLSEPLPRKYARIATAPDTARLALGAAIVEMDRDENGVIGELVAANKKRKLVKRLLALTVSGVLFSGDRVKRFPIAMYRQLRLPL